MRIDINRGDCSKEQSCYQRGKTLRDKTLRGKTLRGKTLKQVTICSNTENTQMRIKFSNRKIRTDPTNDATFVVTKVKQERAQGGCLGTESR